jgi:alpha-aminoadipic semialdehyde synthase
MSCIAIVRECKNKWERRCSLTPIEVEKLVKQSIKVLVQPSTNRCYSDEEFEEVGGIIQEDISEASVIFGVKEVPMENLLKDKTYFFFTHTIKAQDYNMPLLDKLLEQRVRMVDFESIRDKTGSQRLVAFGRYAGIAGAFDFLRGCGEFMLQKGYQTPLIHLGSAYMYEDFSVMKDALGKIAC